MPCASALALVQGSNRFRHDAWAMGVWFVTRGAQVLGAGDLAARLAGAALWGFGKAVDAGGAAVTAENARSRPRL